MDESSAPPAYAEHHPSAEYNWRIRNARYRSEFAVNRRPEVGDYREHLECMKDSILTYSREIGSPASPVDDAPDVAVEYSQSFGDVGHLICEYQACLEKIQPLQEEDVLFLLLSRYARSTGFGVYVEVSKSTDVQVYDSNLTEPPHTAGIQDALTFGSGVVNARVPVTMNSPFVPSQDGIYPYELIPQTPPHNTAECTVTVNFPDMQLVGDGAPNRPPAYPATPQQQYQQREYENHMATIDWGPELSKLQAPPFRVHRCHHEGMERGGEGSRFELPDGFPEAVRQMCLVPESTYHVGFYINDRSRKSLPVTDGGVQAFECHIFSCGTYIFLTVQRRGNMLEYNCFRDEEVRSDI